MYICISFAVLYGFGSYSAFENILHQVTNNVNFGPSISDQHLRVKIYPSQYPQSTSRLTWWNHVYISSCKRFLLDVEQPQNESRWFSFSTSFFVVHPTGYPYMAMSQNQDTLITVFWPIPTDHHTFAAWTLWKPMKNHHEHSSILKSEYIKDSVNPVESPQDPVESPQNPIQPPQNPIQSPSNPHQIPFTFRFISDFDSFSPSPSGCDFDSASTNSTSRARQRSPRRAQGVFGSAGRGMI